MKISEQDVWAKLKECYDPEIPCNVVDLGLVYDVRLQPVAGSDDAAVNVKMTLTAIGCPMAGQISGNVQHKLLEMDGVSEANVEIVFDPPWNQSMISEEGRRRLGLV
jgi:metal-sulfur cluster biosynthetic enzyme